MAYVSDQNHTDTCKQKTYRKHTLSCISKVTRTLVDAKISGSLIQCNGVIHYGFIFTIYSIFT